MAPDTAPLSAQSLLFTGLCSLFVFIIWIRNRAESPLLPLALGLLAFCCSSLCALLFPVAFLSPLLLTVGLIFLHWGAQGSRPGPFLGCLLLLVLVSHFLILLLTEPGYSQREAACFLVWTGLSLLTASSLVSRDDSTVTPARLPLFLLFGIHALFCLCVTSAFQLGLVGRHPSEMPTLIFYQQTELSLFSVLLVGIAFFARLNERTRQLEEELNLRGSIPSLVPVCSACRQVRDHNEAWSGMETYLQNKLDFKFTHGICPSCADSLYPGVNMSSTIPRAVRRAVSHHPFPPPSPLERGSASRELAQAK